MPNYWKNGQAVEGRVVAIEPTDVLLDNQPVSRFTVTYAQEGGERRAVFEQRVPFTDLPRVQPGAAVPLRLGGGWKDGDRSATAQCSARRGMTWKSSNP
ncbi:hypothetical protein ACFS3C_13520 [Azotobacter vinelandii]